MRAVQVERVLAAHRLDRSPVFALRRGRDRRPDRAPLEQIDHRKLRQLGNRQLGELAKGLLEVERLVEHQARLR